MLYVQPIHPAFNFVAKFLDEKLQKLVAQHYLAMNLPKIELGSFGFNMTSAYCHDLNIVRLNLDDCTVFSDPRVHPADRKELMNDIMEVGASCLNEFMLYVLLHELGHGYQQATGVFRVGNNTNMGKPEVWWKGTTYVPDSPNTYLGFISHCDLPWERDANDTAKALYRIAMYEP